MHWIWWCLCAIAVLALLIPITSLVCFLKVFYSPRKKPLGPDEYEIPDGEIYTSDDYKELLKSLHIRQSMDGKSRWADNIMIERWFRSLKTEKIYIEEYATERELRACIDSFIDQYNNVRPHESLDNATPASVYAASFAA